MDGAFDVRCRISMALTLQSHCDGGLQSILRKALNLIKI